MSRILEFQPTDEQTIVARVLLDLHQAIDSSFPNASESSRQFTKTVLSEIESTQADQRPGDALSAGQSYSKSTTTRVEAKSSGTAQTLPQTGAKSAAENNKKSSMAQAGQDLKSFQSGLEFSGAEEDLQSLTATSLSERPWSIWLTRFLIVSLLAGGVLLAWIYLFGPPTF